MTKPMTGTEMRILRAQLGLSQPEFAERIPSVRKPGQPVSRLAVRAWESGRTPIPDDVAETVRAPREELLTAIDRIVDELEQLGDEARSLSLAVGTPEAAARAALFDVALRVLGWEPTFAPTEPSASERNI